MGQSRGSQPVAVVLVFEQVTQKGISLMKQQTMVVVGASLAVLLVAAALLEPTQTVSGRLAGDTFLAGRPSRYWANQLLGGPSSSAAALSILEKQGAEAVPVLSEIYQKFPGEARSELRWTALELLAKKSPLPAAAQSTMLRALSDPDPHVRSVAIAAVPKAGVSAEEVVPKLKELLRGEHRSEERRVGKECSSV